MTHNRYFSLMNENGNSQYFSVVIPLYNKRKHIKRAIDSVLGQTLGRYEIIVVNDGSNDGGECIVSDYKHDNIKLINQKNSGVSIARNTGILNAKFDFVCLLDADDEWKPNFLAEIAKLIHTYPEHHLYSVKHEIVRNNGDLIYPNVCLQENFKGVIKDFIHLYKNSDGIINSSSVCLRKDYFHKLGGFPAGQTQGEDIYLWLLYALHTNIVFSNKVCTRYYRNSESRSVDTIIKNTLPFQFVHFYPLIKQDKTGYSKVGQHKNELIRYLRKDALLHIADLKSRNKTIEALSHSSLLFAYSRATGLLCYFITLLPNTLLVVIKSMRNFQRHAR